MAASENIIKTEPLKSFFVYFTDEMGYVGMQKSDDLGTYCDTIEFRRKIYWRFVLSSHHVNVGFFAWGLCPR